MERKFRKMDKLVCVHCQAVRFEPAVGKGSRTFMVECVPSCEGVERGVSAKNEPGGKPAKLP